MSRPGLLDGALREARTAARSAQAGQQVVRFCRLFVMAFVAQLAALGATHLGRSALVGAGVGALEVAFRQFAPVKPVVPWSVVGPGRAADVVRLAPPRQPPPVPPVPPPPVPPAG